MVDGKGIVIVVIAYRTWPYSQLSNPFVGMQVKEKVNVAIKGLQQLSAYTSLDQHGTADWVINTEERPWG